MENKSELSDVTLLVITGSLLVFGYYLITTESKNEPQRASVMGSMERQQKLLQDFMKQQHENR